jgi:fumarylacetoacetase
MGIRLVLLIILATSLTHKEMATLRSFINVPHGHHFPIQNIPFSTGIPKNQTLPRCLSRIGDFAIDLGELEDAGFFSDLVPKNTLSCPKLNTFMALGRPVWRSVRARIQDILDIDNPRLRDHHDLKERVFIPINDVQLTLPVDIGDYTDFYASRNHAFNVGAMIRGPDNALQPNWLRMPIGYHGRSSSVVLSGHPVVRPRGQIKLPNSEEPIFTSTKRLDYEYEIGVFVGGQLNAIGKPLDIKSARDNIFGLVILNDWSARDVQIWEYAPLGPFTAKNFITTISPWIVTLDALEPFKVELGAQDPAPLPYLQETDHSSYDILLKTYLKTPGLQEPALISSGNMQYLYWSITQQLTHHTVTGCNMRVGDMFGTGTISGPSKETVGCLLEMSLNGKEPIELPNGEKRTFLEDGDTVSLSAECIGEGFTIGFGDCTSQVHPALSDEYFS